MKPLHRNPVFALAALLVALGSGGCMSRFTLPEVSGSSLEYKRTDSLGGTTISASNVEVTETEVKAERASWVTTYPQFSVSLTVTDYKRKRATTP